LIERRVIEAAKDYKYLLNRGYNAELSLNLVSNRYSLSKYEKLLLYRCIHSDEIAKDIRSKLVPPTEVKGNVLIIDGFNVLMTVTSMLEGDTLFLCDDGLIRDLRSLRSRGLLIESPILRESLNLVNNVVNELSPSKVVFILDKQVSWSAVLSRMVNEVTGFDVLLSGRADKEVIIRSTEGVISSSDVVILMKAPKIYDVAGHVIRVKGYSKIIDILKYLKEGI